jgi:trehalose 6-phosphate synthase
MGTITTKEDLRQITRRRLKDRQLIVVSNREPYIHEYDGEKVVCQQPVGGLTTAIDPVLRASGGTWIAYGSGKADQDVVDANGRVMVPPEDPSYTLRRVWLSHEELDGYYSGFANSSLWPLCHIAYTRPVFNSNHWDVYSEVNRKFAEAIMTEAEKQRALVLIQDYHFALLPKYLKEMGFKGTVIHFWHIPWPSHEVLRICPWRREILESMLSNDLLGFHVMYFCNNFVECVEKELEARFDRDRYAIIYKRKKTLVRHFPISVDWEAIGEASADNSTVELRKALSKGHRLRGKRIILGVDRIDYSKGIPERLRAYELFLERHPEAQGKVVLVQIGVKSRAHIPAYRELIDRIEDCIEELNWKYETEDWEPVVYLSTGLSQQKLYALYGMADVMMVSSLHDGMNLVCKEFVASRDDEKGVLVLSRFTGAARELTDALLINPYDASETADVMARALEMPEAEQTKRMRSMRLIVADHNIYDWACDIITAIGRLR